MSQTNEAKILVREQKLQLSASGGPDASSHMPLTVCPPSCGRATAPPREDTKLCHASHSYMDAPVGALLCNSELRNFKEVITH